MPPVKTVICLANSRKHGAFCFAGIDSESGKWVRPVSQLDDGRVERAAMTDDGTLPGLCDIVEIPLDKTAFIQNPFPGPSWLTTTYPAPDQPNQFEALIPGGTLTMVLVSTGLLIEPTMFHPAETEIESRVRAQPVIVTVVAPGNLAQ